MLTLSDGFNLYVDVATPCNARCAFCIAPTIGRRDGPLFFDGLRWALDGTEMWGGSVQIVGGEPTISPRFRGVLHEVSLRTFHRAVLVTNGSGLGPHIGAFAQAGITHVNVSRHHDDEARNQAIMRTRPPLPNATLAALIQDLLGVGVNVRLNCNLIRGEIEDAPSMLRYAAWAALLGAGSVSFSQLFPLGLFEHQAPLQPGYCESRQADLVAIVKALDRLCEPDPSVLRAASVWGRSSWGAAHDQPHGKRRYWRTDAGMTFSLKTLSGYDPDGLPRPTGYAKGDDPELAGELCFAVVHPDGRVTASWDRRERLLYDPADAERSTISRLEAPLVSRN